MPQKLITFEECAVKEKSDETLSRVSSLCDPVKKHTASFSISLFIQYRQSCFHFQRLPPDNKDK